MRVTPLMRKCKNNSFIILSCILLGIFCCTLFTAFFHSIHIDEIDWLKITSRAFYDGLRMNNPNFQCEDRISWDIPWTLVPGRLIASIFHPINMIEFRLIGSTLYVAIIIVLAAIARELSGIKWIYALAGVAALLSIGILPYGMVSIRPESSIAFGLFAFVLVFILLKKEKIRLSAFWILFLLFFFCSWFFSLHPKALLFAPAFLLATLAMPLRRFLSVPAMLFIIFMAWQGYGMWDNYLYCPNPGIDYIHRNWAVRIGDFSVNPADWISRFLINWKLSGEKYILSILFRQEYMNCGVAIFPNLFPDFIMSTMRIVIVSTLLCVFGFCVTALYGSVASISRQRLPSQWAFFIIGLIGLAMLFFLGLKSNCNDYETPLLWPLGVLLVIGCLSAPLLRNRWRRPLAALFVLVLLVSMASQLVLLIYGAPQIRFNMQAHTDNGEVPFRKDRQTLRGYDARLARMQKAANMCNISLGPDSHHVVFDDITYLAVRHTVEPLELTPLTFQQGNDVGMVHYVKRLNSDGVLMLCNRMDKSIRGAAIEVEGICCISRQALQQFP